MKCPFCAEEIQEAAVLCRFCGAQRHAGTWIPPARLPGQPYPARPKGTLTIKAAGVCFLLSGVWSLFALAAPVPLAGQMRGGATAVAYNGVFAALFLAMGAGLFTAWRWGLHVALAGTAAYTVDKALFLLDRNNRDAYLAASGITSDVADMLGAAFLDQTLVLISLTLLACWWGFAVYLYLRRGYFRFSAALIAGLRTADARTPHEPGSP